MSRATAPETERSTPRRVPVDPKVRERWVAARRAEGRRRLWVAVAVATLVLLFGGAWAVASSPLLDVDHVVVKGMERTTTDQVTSAAHVGVGDAMVWIDDGGAEDRIDALPWIRSAHVVREWPGTVRITVTERTAAGWVATGNGAALVDGSGRVLERVHDIPTDLPELVGIDTVPPVGAAIEPRVTARVAGRLTGLVRSGTKSVSVTPAGVVLGLVAGPEIRLGQPTAVVTKVHSAVAVLGALEGAGVAYIDVSVPSNPVAGPPV